MSFFSAFRDLLLAYWICDTFGHFTSWWHCGWWLSLGPSDFKWAQSCNIEQPLQLLFWAYHCLIARILAKLSLETGPVPSPDNPHEASFLHCGLRGEGVISATGDGGVGNSLPTKQHGGKPLEDFGLKCGNATTLQIRKRRFRRAYRRLRVHGVTWYRGHFWQQQVAQPIPCDF